MRRPPPHQAPAGLVGSWGSATPPASLSHDAGGRGGEGEGEGIAELRLTYMDCNKILKSGHFNKQDCPKHNVWPWKSGRLTNQDTSRIRTLPPAPRVS